MNPCTRVIQSCEYAALRLQDEVQINDAALSALATELAAGAGAALPSWDEHGWHYSDVTSPLTAQYVLVLDALNFCFWPSSTSMEYDTLAVSLRQVLQRDADAFSASRLRAVDAATISSWFAPQHLPHADERARKLNEVGEVLEARYDGLAVNVIAAAKGSAVELVRLMVADFPGFRDESILDGRQVFFYKRAQIFVGDVWAAYGRRTDVSASTVAFNDMAALTCFADYRIPQLLRALGVFVYAPALAAAVDEKRELPPHSREEIAIRACTVVAVQRLRDEMHAAAIGSSSSSAPALTSVEVDWLLWNRGERVKDAIAPHHRTLTVFY